MPAITTRQEARERLLKIALSAIDRVVPADGSVPLRGATFSDFENQSYSAGEALLTAMMEERAKLERNASVEEPGLCPHRITRDSPNPVRYCACVPCKSKIAPHDCRCKAGGSMRSGRLLGCVGTCGNAAAA